MPNGDVQQPPKRGLVRSIITFVAYIAVIFGMVWLLQNFVVCPYNIPSASMESTIETGDSVWSEKISYYFRSPQAGDIVTFEDPQTAGRTLIKRVIATGGQTVDLQDGVVYVDGVALDETYATGTSEPLNTASGVTVSYPYTVPEGYLWVMGDNRNNSADSRFFGAIDSKTVTGHAVAIYWPINHIGVL